MKIFLHRHTGFTLVEILVALLILSVGLLGLAGLQTMSMRSNYSAYMRSQANILAYDIIDRMRTNRNEALNNNLYLVNFDAAPPAPGDCNASACDSTQLANYDLAQWKCSLGKWNSTAVCQNTLSINGVLSEGDGQVVRNGDIFTVTIRYQERQYTEAIDANNELVSLSISTQL